VFIELSLDCYLEDNALTKSVTATTSEIDLFQKVAVVSDHLGTRQLSDKALCKGIKTSTKNRNDILGIDSWHAYVHNNKFSPIAENLIITWDNIEAFISIIWESIK
jgi:hypothetical protein